MLDRAVEEQKLIRVSTPRSSAINLAVLLIVSGTLILVPTLSITRGSQTFAYLALSGLSLALLRVSRNAMVLRPEVSDRQLSAAECAKKARLKFILKIMSLVLITLVALLSEIDSASLAVVPVAVLIGLSYFFTLLAGVIYQKKYIVTK